MMDVGTCRSCGAEILWCRTVNNKSIPVDAKPVEYGGNIVIRDGVAITLKRDEPSEAGEKRYRSHFATCPDAKKFRSTDAPKNPDGSPAKGA
jgi:hypothetical protein